MEKVTVEKLKEFGDVYEAIKWAQGQNLPYPSRPIKPTLGKDVNSKSALAFAKELDLFESSMRLYEEEKDKWNTIHYEIQTVIESFIKEEAGIEIVPEKYRDKLYYQAYERGHSSGYYEVYGCLQNLISIFE